MYLIYQEFLKNFIWSYFCHNNYLIFYYIFRTDTAVKHVDAVQQVDPIQVINETESAVLLKNKAVLKAVFDAKRNAVQALKDISKFTTNFTVDAVGTTNLNMEALLNNTAIQWELMNNGLVNFWNTTLSNLNLALTNAQSNIQVSIINNNDCLLLISKQCNFYI